MEGQSAGGSGSAFERLPSPLLAVVAALFLAGAGLVGGSIVGRATLEGLERLGIELSVVPATILSTLLLQGVAFGGLSLLYLSYREVSPLEYIGVRMPSLEGWMYAAAGYVLAFAAAFSLIFVVVFLLGLSPAQNRAAELGQEDPRVFLVLVVLAVFVIGPGEELLFRGVVQGRLRETFSAPVAVGLATAIFAGVHWTSLAGPVSGRALTVTMLFVPGLVFGVTYEMTDNIVVPALVHGAYNATLFMLAYVSTAFG
jgi:membrane protease YdiL (CAAX protease family)